MLVGILNSEYRFLVELGKFSELKHTINVWHTVPIPDTPVICIT